MFDTLFKGMKFKDVYEEDKFRTLVDAYMTGIPENFYKNQFELAKEIGGEFQDWVKILSYDTFRTWKAEQIAIIASTKTDQALAGGDSLANKDMLPLLKVRQDILKEEKSSDKPPIVVLPESLFFDENN